MGSIVLISTANIYPGLIVAIFICIINVFILLLLLANKKLPIGQRFLKVREVQPSVSLADLANAFPEWDSFTAEYEDTVKAYRANYEKLTGVELEDEENEEEEEDRDIKPFTVMEDFTEVLPQRQKYNTDEIVYQEVEGKSKLETSKLADSNTFVAKPPGFAAEDEKQAKERQPPKAEDRNLFGNAELLKFFALENKGGYKLFEEDDTQNRRKTAKYAPILAPGFEDDSPERSLAPVKDRATTEAFLKPFREEQKDWNVAGEGQGEKAGEWKPFVVGEFHRKSLDMNDDGEDDWGGRQSGGEDFAPIKGSAKQGEQSGRSAVNASRKPVKPE